MVEKENIPSATSAELNKAEERRKQLEEYLKAKREKKEAERSDKSQRLPHSKNNGKALIEGPSQKQLDRTPYNFDGHMIQTATSKTAIPEGGSNVETFSPGAGQYAATSVDNCPSQGKSQRIITTNQVARQPYECPDKLLGLSNETFDLVSDTSVVTNPRSVRMRIDWSVPVYLCHGRQLCRLRRPQTKLFRLAQVRDAIKKNHTLLASMMLAVLSAEGQCKSQDVRYQREYWRLKMQVSKLPQAQMIQEASRFIPRALLNSLAPIDIQDTPVTSCASPNASRQDETQPKTPSTPELPAGLLISPTRTPELDDAETRRMQAEIDDVVQRTPAIQDTPSRRPQARLLDKALTAIKDTSLFSRNRHRTNEENERIKLDGGSAYLYAMITPSKRLRGLLATDVAVSPVRRSKRLLDRDATPKKDLYERIDDIPDISSIGYVPNSHMDALMHPKRKLFKVDGASNSDPDQDNGQDPKDQGNNM